MLIANDKKAQTISIIITISIVDTKITVIVYNKDTSV